MKKIKEFKTSHLRNGEHYDYITFVISLITVAIATKLKIEKLLTQLKASFSVEDLSFKQEQSSLYTAKASEADRVCDQLWSYIRSEVATKQKSPVAATKEAAVVFGHLTDTYGAGVSQKTYGDEIALWKNFLTDADVAPYKEAATTIGLTAALTEMHTAVAALETVFRSRDAEAAQKADVVAMKDIRPTVDAAYRDIVAALNALYHVAFEVTNDKEIQSTIEPIIDALNTAIARWENTMITRMGILTANQKKKDEAEAAKLGITYEEYIAKKKADAAAKAKKRKTTKVTNVTVVVDGSSGTEGGSGGTEEGGNPDEKPGGL